MKRRVIVIGGGIAGMQTALTLDSEGFEVQLIERETQLGGKLKEWHLLFPTFTPAEEVLAPLREALRASRVELLTGCTAVALSPKAVQLSDGRTLPCDAVVVASGFSLFDARLKEEYGYGLYDNVYTSRDVERMMREGRVCLKDGSEPRRIALLHCVGSRDAKVCRLHCSRVCCVTGVKQAMELRKCFPTAEIFNFYMDIRMFGPGYEEMYREAQLRDNIHFIRGRISEAAPTFDGRVQIKAEDTLTARPLRMSVDMLVLMVGMEGAVENESLARSADLPLLTAGFFAPRDWFYHATESPVEGIFYAGTVTAPKTVGESLHEATAAAHRVKAYLTRL